MKTNQNRQNESGNVLFLILIAVALFAALSYAVTQSTRSGSGTTERETVLLNSASLTQYPTTLRTAVVRMILAGFDIGNVGFEAPSHVNFNDGSARNRVFHPTGGGAVFQTATPEVMDKGAATGWYYNGNFEIPQIGQSGAGGNDVIAFLPRVTISMCRRLNEELGIVVTGSPTNTGVPDFNATDAQVLDTHELGDTFPTNATGLGGALPADFTGQPAGCFYDASLNGTPAFVFYSVLLER